MDQESFDRFVKEVIVQSNCKKFISEDIICELIDYFQGYEKESYLETISAPLDLALKFYEQYDIEYYNMIKEGITNKLIVISNEKGSSETTIKTCKTKIYLSKNDKDVFLLVHEFAHFIDRSSSPTIIPDEHNNFGEIFSFYFEKLFESWLDKSKYKKLILTRRNNRMYFEQEMLKAVKYELYYENLYKKNGFIDIRDIDDDKVKFINQYGFWVNYLLRYPIANIFSDYIIKNDLLKLNPNFCECCLNINIDDALKSFKDAKKLVLKEDKL